ncbi:uncharacterized protein LOC124653427 isoform X2 [Lolium rigidum]|uniref:uncharacterized protein LOC124653427 isoform X2 n=1 Tax=Lolium rigidum TaxID=89674 RepID=UPI001F5D7237|nr:uncharacterized protein LOC124653427 isoform X2 [Lolium rigidum]
MVSLWTETCGTVHVEASSPSNVRLYSVVGLGQCMDAFEKDSSTSTSSLDKLRLKLCGVQVGEENIVSEMVMFSVCCHNRYPTPLDRFSEKEPPTNLESLKLESGK